MGVLVCKQMPARVAVQVWGAQALCERPHAWRRQRGAGQRRLVRVDGGRGVPWVELARVRARARIGGWSLVFGLTLCPEVRRVEDTAVRRVEDTLGWHLG